MRFPAPSSLVRLSILALAVSLPQRAFSDERDRLTSALQEAVNWYRTWYSEPGDDSAMTSSSAICVVLADHAHVVLPRLQLAADLAITEEGIFAQHVGRMPAYPDARAAVDAYIQRQRRIAELVASGKSDRFDRGSSPERNPVLEAVRRDEIRIIELESIPLPYAASEPPSKEQQVALESAVRAALRDDSGFSACSPQRAIVSRYGLRDSLVFVFVENAAPDCPASIMLFKRRGSQWSYEELRNRSGDLDGLVERIRSRTGSVFTMKDRGGE